MDFTELLFYVISVLGAVAVVFLRAVYTRLTERYDWLDELDADKVVEEYIMKGVMYAESHLVELAEKYGKNVDIKSPEIVQEVVSYVMAYAPKALKKLGFSEEYLTDLVESYLLSDEG